MPSDHTALLILPAEAGNSLLQAAETEFHATLQLLADRACWVCGARSGEIAFEDQGEMRYMAVSGASEHEPGTTVASNERQFSECMLRQRQSTAHRGMNNESTFSLAVPVIEDTKAIGFIHLSSSSEFNKESETAISGIAELVTVARQHRDAAERAEKLEFRDNELELPSRWFAPEHSEPQRQVAETQETATTSATMVGTCKACGFPVSPGRTLCVECERKSEATTASDSLFKSETEESWLSTHGYTIASLIVTMLTAAIILWLRH
jgi:transcriptional regulator with GAF, ATPase, and Fis domain